jgi:hypothetical protein
VLTLPNSTISFRVLGEGRWKRGFSAELTERRPGTGDFRGLLSRSLGPMIYVRINVDGGLFSATHCRRDAGDAMGCGCVTVRCACVIGEGTAGTGIRRRANGRVRRSGDEG